MAQNSGLYSETTKMEKSLKKGGPVAGPNWDPAQKEAPRPGIITADKMCLQKGGYHDCPLKGPTNSWKSQMQIFAPNQSTETGKPYGWIRGNLEEAEEEGDLIERLGISTNPEVP